MAAGNVILYNHGINAIMRGDIDLQSTTLVCAFVSHSYSPSQASHSSWSAQISAYELTVSGYAAKIIASPAVSIPDASHVRFDAADTTLSATSLMTAKYAVVRAQTSGVPLCYVDLDTGSTSGVDATQITLQWNALGLFQANQAL